MPQVIDRAGSEEILRLIIRRMAEHPATFTPNTYAVWYEFLTGINLSLSKTVLQLFSENRKLDDAAIDELYTEYILKETESSIAAQQLLKNDVKALLLEVAQFTEDTDKRVSEIDGTIKEGGRRLKQRITSTDIDSIIDDIISGTESMSDVVRNLRVKLKESKTSVDELYTKLVSARNESLTDPLTGLLNRRGFEAKINDLVYNEVSILMIDMDNFKGINDKYGHLFGDSAIQIVANILSNKVRNTDTVARWGGDEFVILLPEANIRTGYRIAMEIKETIERYQVRITQTKKNLGNLTVSIGLASSFDPTESIATLLDGADKALYASKSAGRNRVSVYSKKVAD